MNTCSIRKMNKARTIKIKNGKKSIIARNDLLLRQTAGEKEEVSKKVKKTREKSTNQPTR